MLVLVTEVDAGEDAGRRWQADRVPLRPIPDLHPVGAKMVIFPKVRSVVVPVTGAKRVARAESGVLHPVSVGALLVATSNSLDRGVAAQDIGGMPLCSWCHLRKGVKLMSKEHIFADWMNQVFQPTNGRYEITYWHERRGHEPREWSKQKQRISEVVATVCRACNNGWMSQLETQSKPLLTPLMMDAAAITLASADAITLAVWAAKTVGVIEDVEGRQVMTDMHRDLIKAGVPPPPMRLHLGRYVGLDGPAWFRRRIASAPDGSAGAAVTALVVGACLIVVTQWPVEQKLDLNDVAAGPSWTSLWPPPGESLNWPPDLGVRDDAVDGLMQTLAPFADFEV
jgi:hypothetical protein